MDNRTQSLSVDVLNDLLLSVHFGLAAMLHTPEIALDMDEARKLANASANVMRHYNVRTTAKAMDWIQLSITLGVIYGPRAVVFAARRKPREPARANGAHNPADELAGISHSMIM